MSEIELKRLFESEYNAAFEGDFATYANGEYVNEYQQDFFDGFKAGIKISEFKIAKITAPPSEAEIESVGNAIKETYDAIDKHDQLSEFDKINTAKAAITKWLEMRSNYV